VHRLIASGGGFILLLWKDGKPKFASGRFFLVRPE
jgi:hypothetical protein